ncbi:MAG TPA: hypothetical protein VMN36_09855 [Verrucomicrobiales bacterium]|nr:hypothetical protein [Verrucomicrobiales bacterium]
MRSSRQPRSWKKPSLIVTLILLILAACQLWRQNGDPGPALPKSNPIPQASQAGPHPRAAQQVGAYQLLHGAKLVRSRGNDGDSFRIAWNSKEYVFRLYFVDCPETSDRFPERIDYQADYFGIQDRRRVLALGEQAKSFTLGLLETEPFEVFTRWEPVMNSERFHAFVRFPLKEKGGVWLSELLVQAGLARIYTRPADLPDGTRKGAFQDHLRALEREANTSEMGGWKR